MSEPFAPFLEAAAAAVDLLSQPEIAEYWDQGSALEQFPVSGLAGHLLRALTTVEVYLQSAPPAEDPVGAGEYFTRLVSSDLNRPGNQAIRARGQEVASGGPLAVASQAQATYQRLSARLPGEDPARRMKVAGDLVMSLEDYLRTRVVELLIHSDDLAASIGHTFRPPSPGICTVAIGTLVDAARIRHGDMAVLRALARRERDSVQALRVI